MQKSVMAAMMFQYETAAYYEKSCSFEENVKCVKICCADVFDDKENFWNGSRAGRIL